MKKLIVLGSTGSIGESTLSIVHALPDLFTIVGLACRRRRERLAEQVLQYQPSTAAIVEDDRGLLAAARPGIRVYRGAEGILRMIEETDADIVVNGISGAAGLLPSFSALRSGKDLALANKESLVMAGMLVLKEASLLGRRVLPVDSEHAALFNILQAQDPDEVAELTLTASGGAFRDLPLEELAHVRFADALQHPTWKMGAKITVDSASMANKGLEVIEAHRLFGIALPKIRVLIHPQSHVHSLVRTVDGTLHAEISTPDMRIPIQNALTYPVVMGNEVNWLDLAGMSLAFLPVDERKYRMLGLAYLAAGKSEAHPVVFNAVNEEAVAAFMNEEIPFLGIPDIVEDALGRDWTSTPGSVEEVLSIDAAARREALELRKGMAL